MFNIATGADVYEYCFGECLTVELAAGMTVDETKAICMVHVQFGKQQLQIFDQYQKILHSMSKNGGEVAADALQAQYQTLVNEKVIDKAVAKYSALLAAFDTYEIKHMEWKLNQKKLKKSPHRVAQRKAAMAQEKRKDKEKNANKNV